ncbi:protein kinase domain-containing protein [Nocardia abscessus]|uniref:protein kinase domain-containing protein n=1 Tax=Nocardia abscessus TaxID=120957 RepID=UPI0024558D67|nr:hypothetical protein [Nocardia abscessus]
MFTATGVEVTASPTLTEGAGYVAPEVASGTAADAAADVFALGAVLVFAATGIGPFGTGTPLELLNRTLTCEPDLDAVPQQLRQVVADCLSRDPQRRPSAADLATRLTFPQSSTEPDVTSPDPVAQPPESTGLSLESIAPPPNPTFSPPDPIPERPQSSTAASESVVPSRESVVPSTRPVVYAPPAPKPAAPQMKQHRLPRLPRRGVRIAIEALFSVVVLVAATIFAVVYHRPTDAASAASPTPSRAVIATPEVSALAVSPDGRRIYVGSWKQPTVSVIDTATNVVTALVGVPQEPKGLAVSADGAYVYVVCADAVSVIATTSNTTIGVAIADHGTFSQAVAVSRDGTHLYVADGLRATVTVRNARTRDATATIPLGAEHDMVEAVALTPDGRHLFAEVSGQIATIDTTTATVTARTALDGVGATIAISPDGRSVYVVSQSSSTLHILDAATGAKSGTVQLKGTSAGIAVSPSGRYVFVANKPHWSGRSAGDITVFDSTSRTVVGEIQSGVGAGRLVLTPDGHRLYASPLKTDGSGVAVVDVSRYN